MDCSNDPIYHKRIIYNYILVIIDCFSKLYWCFMNKQQTPEQLINCYEQLFNDVKPVYMWWDMEKQLIVKISVIFEKSKRQTLQYLFRT